MTEHDPQSASNGAPHAEGRARPWRPVAIAVAAILAVGVVLYAADWFTSSDRVPRGVTVAGVAVGGQTSGDAEATLREELGPRAEQPIAVRADDASAEIVPAQAGLGIDWSATLDRAGAQPLSPITRLTSFFDTREIGIVSTVDEPALTAAVDGLRPVVDRAPVEGDVVIDEAGARAVEPLAGRDLDAEGAATALERDWASGTTVELPFTEIPVTVTGDGVQSALTEVAQPAVSASVTVTGDDGVAATLPPERVGEVLRFEPDGDGGLRPEYDVEVATAILGPQLESTETRSVDARFDFSSGSPTVVPSVPGNTVQWPETLETLPDLLLAIGDARAVPAIYGSQPAGLTTEDAQALGIREVIGEFTSGGFEYASGVNIGLTADIVNGAVVRPGETFSLNGYTGPRGTSRGFVESGIIDNGRPDRAVGGGISQFATTLYNAGYFAGMEDVEHTEHSYYINRYPEAREATVFEGAIDLKFRNNGDTGVVVQSFADSSQVTVRLWGTKTVDVESVTGSRSRPTQPETVRLPEGDDCIASSGAPGFTTSDTRIIRDAQTGEEISRNTRTVRYDPVPIVRCE